jgi:hypothetical protein
MREVATMPDAGAVRSLTMLLALALGAATLGACSSEIRLRHQFTGETAVCQGSPFSQSLVRCLEHHEREGYRRVSQ